MKIGNYTKEERIEAFKNANYEDKLRYVGLLLDLLESKDSVISSLKTIVSTLETQNYLLKEMVKNLEKKEEEKKEATDTNEEKTLDEYQWIYEPKSSCIWYGVDAYDKQRLLFALQTANEQIILKDSHTLTVAEVLMDMGEKDIPKEFFVYGWRMPRDYYLTTEKPYISWDIKWTYKNFGDGPVNCLRVDFNCDGYVKG